MDRISDSGSDGCGSIPHGGTKRGFGPFLCTWSTPSHCVTAPVGHTDRSLSPFLCTRVICTTDQASGNTLCATEGHSEASRSNDSRPGRSAVVTALPSSGHNYMLPFLRLPELCSPYRRESPSVAYASLLRVCEARGHSDVWLWDHCSKVILPA